MISGMTHGPTSGCHNHHPCSLVALPVARMGSIAWQGGQLLHGLWSHAERAILHGRPPGGVVSSSGRHGGAGVLRDAGRTNALRNAVHTSKPTGKVNSHTKHLIPESFVQSVRYFAEDALTAVFKGMQQRVEPEGAKLARSMVRASRQASRPRSYVPTGNFVRPTFRPTSLPRSPDPVQRTTKDVGLQLARSKFSSLGYDRFADQIITNAPLALRAIADEVEEKLRKGRKHSNTATLRAAGVPSSTRRSGSAIHKLRMQELIRSPKPLSSSSYEPLSEAEASQRSSSSSSAECSVANSVVYYSGAPASFCLAEETHALDDDDALNDHDYYFPPSPLIEPSVTTQLVIPLCPDLSTILCENIEPNFRDDRSMQSFLQDYYDVTDQYHRHRLKRIVVIERAFDQEPLRSYRPASWQEDMLVGLMRDDQPFPDAYLTVHFPDCTVDEVKEMLFQAMSAESALWFSRFLNEVTRIPSFDSDNGGEMQLFDPPTLHSSSSLTDLGRDVDAMGAASLVSMADYHGIQNCSFSGPHNETLRFPAVDVRTPDESFHVDVLNG